MSELNHDERDLIIAALVYYAAKRSGADVGECFVLAARLESELPTEEHPAMTKARAKRAKAK